MVCATGFAPEEHRAGKPAPTDEGAGRPRRDRNSFLSGGCKKASVAREGRKGYSVSSALAHPDVGSRDISVEPMKDGNGLVQDPGGSVLVLVRRSDAHLSDICRMR